MRHLSAELSSPKVREQHDHCLNIIMERTGSDTQTNTQGRIQDLSEGGARFISEQKSRFRNKKKRKDRYFSCFAQVFFPLSAIKKLCWNLRGGDEGPAAPANTEPRIWIQVVKFQPKHQNSFLLLTNEISFKPP